MERVLTSILSTPWAMCEPQLSTLARVVARRVILGMPLLEDFQAAEKRQSAMVGEVAVLPLFGVIVPRGDSFNSSGATSAEAFTRQFDMLVADPAVKAIVLDIDSPGGAVAGVPETAAKVMAARAVKPIVAQSNQLCASAAYYIASQAHEIVSAPSGSTGSIGVVVMHEAIGRQLDAEGVDITYVSAGKYKTEVNERDILEGEALANVQSRVDEFYTAFVGAVAAGRGVTPAAVRGGYGEGRVLGAQPALAAGLVDRIGTLDETLARLQTSTGRNAARRRGMRGDINIGIEEVQPPTAEEFAREFASEFEGGQ